MQSTLTAKNGVAWTNLFMPEPEELATFVRTVNLLPIDAEFVAQNYRRPEITVRPNYVLFLIHIPVFNRQTRVTSGAALYILVQDTQVWTLQFEPIVVLEKILKDFAETQDKQEEYFSDGALGLGLYVINELYASAFRKLERLYKHITIAEDAVFGGNERKMVEEIAVLVRDILDFRKIIRPQRNLFQYPPVHPLVTPTAQALWGRLNGQVSKLWEILEGLFESASELSLTNSKLLQLKENGLLQILTYYSIISIPVLLFLTPFNPRNATAKSYDSVLYWGVLGALIILLGLIFLRYRGKRVL